MCAAFRARNAAARAACAESLDRFLLSIGRKQKFDTVKEGGEPKDPSERVQAFILKEYGLAK
jgi:hypothetical protein